MPAVPADNPLTVAKVELGRRLFFESRLSEGGQIACATCHQPRRAYTDGLARPRGARGEALSRNAPSLANVVYRPAYGWGPGGPSRLEEQMQTPLRGVHPVEMGLAGREPQVLALLSGDERYRAGFARAFPADAQPLSIENLIRAIASFERTLISGRSAFDRYVFDDDEKALSPAARRGMALFYSSRARCGQCHSGIDFSGEIRAWGHEQATGTYADTGVSAQERGPFKVPSLRNVALTAPYMHDGSMTSLEAVIEFYDRGAGQRRLKPLRLSARERGDLLAFLQSLTDPRFVSADPP